MINNRPLKTGLIVNAYAGIGGEAGLKGSDNEARQKALDYSQSLRSPGRFNRFMTALGDLVPSIEWYTASGIMGESYLSSFTDQYTVCLQVEKETSARETRELALKLLDHDMDILVFVGGDGTARDIVDVVGHRLPVLGIPAGVKMQSGVFAINPEAAANILRDIVKLELATVSEQDVRDIDEKALREGSVSSSYYGSLLVPGEKRYLQHLKQGSTEDETLVRDEIADHLTEIMNDTGCVMLVGPGSTTHHWMLSLGLDNTLVGFDAVQNGELLASDLDGKAIEVLLDQHPDLYLVISPTGSQGSLIGRGNQQLTPRFLAKLPKKQWLVLASKTKLQAYEKKPLFIDTNDIDLDKKLCGLYPIITAYHEQVLYPANIIYEND